MKKKPEKSGAKIKRIPPPEKPKPVSFGGALIRDFGNLPGVLAKFVHVTRRFDADTLAPVEVKDDEVSILTLCESCFGKTNGADVETDEGIVFPAGGLFCLGADGHSRGNSVHLCFKFVPIGELYPAHDFTSIFAVSSKIP